MNSLLPSFFQVVSTPAVLKRGGVPFLSLAIGHNGVVFFFILYTPQHWGFPGGSVVKNLPAMQEMWVRSLGWQNAQEKEMVTHSSILAWEFPWTEDPGTL